MLKEMLHWWLKVSLRYPCVGYNIFFSVTAKPSLSCTSLVLLEMSEEKVVPSRRLAGVQGYLQAKVMSSVQWAPP